MPSLSYADILVSTLNFSVNHSALCAESHIVFRAFFRTVDNKEWYYPRQHEQKQRNVNKLGLLGHL